VPPVATSKQQNGSKMSLLDPKSLIRNKQTKKDAVSLKDNIELGKSRCFKLVIQEKESLANNYYIIQQQVVHGRQLQKELVEEVLLVQFIVLLHLPLVQTLCYKLLLR
jgi:hypothetical protein